MSFFFRKLNDESRAHNVDADLLAGISKGQIVLKMRHSFGDTSVGFFSLYRKTRFQGVRRGNCVIHTWMGTFIDFKQSASGVRVKHIPAL